MSSDLKPLKLHVSKAIPESDFIVSVAKPHDCVIAKLWKKNVVIGSFVTKPEMGKIHQEAKTINLNIVKHWKNCMLNLWLID